ncbi:MAG: tetratricopeptide repeat protein [Blastocatellia bacterium]
MPPESDYDNLPPMKGCTNNRIGQWIALYEFGSLEEREHKIFLDHLIECEYCYDQIYSIEPFSTAFRNHRATALRAGAKESFAFLQRPARARMPWWTWRPAIAAAVSVALAICIGAVVLSGWSRDAGDVDGGDGIKGPQANASPWKDIAVAKAPYVPSKERVVLRSPDESFDHAMAAYQENDFVTAAAQLDALNELEPDNAAEVKFYLGVSLLLAGRDRDAISPLRQVTQLSIGPRLESSHYYLALAYLKSDYQDQAADELDAVIKMKGELRSAAEELKRQISASVK